MKACNLCGSSKLTLRKELHTKPEKELLYGKKYDPSSYWRRTYQCENCGVYCNEWNPVLDIEYDKDWVGTLYADGLLASYNKIRSFPLEKSDNKHRAKRVDAYIRKHGLIPAKTTILDVGCGTCVFLGEMKDLGYNGFAIDPDKVSIEHAKKNVGVEGFAGTLEDFKTDRQFDVITFNKVLEHIKTPIDTLKVAAKHLKENSILYVELPEGDGAGKESYVDREEFWIGHHNIYNEKSLKYLLEKAGFKPIVLKSLRDPSGKYTIYAFGSRF